MAHRLVAVCWHKLCQCQQPLSWQRMCSGADGLTSLSGTWGVPTPHTSTTSSWNSSEPESTGLPYVVHCGRPRLWPTP